MTITLYRFDSEHKLVMEKQPLRRVMVIRHFDKRDVIEGIKRCVANTAGWLAIRLEHSFMGRDLSVGFIFDTKEDGFSLRKFAETFGDVVVDKLKEKSTAILQGA